MRTLDAVQNYELTLIMLPVLTLIFENIALAM